MTVILGQENRIQIILNLNSIREISHLVVLLGVIHSLHWGRGLICAHCLFSKNKQWRYVGFLKSLETRASPCYLQFLSHWSLFSSPRKASDASSSWKMTLAKVTLGLDLAGANSHFMVGMMSDYLLKYSWCPLYCLAHNNCSTNIGEWMNEYILYHMMYWGQSHV